MFYEKVQPTVVTLTNVVSACARAGQFSEVLKSIEMFKKMEVRPNLVTYPYCSSFSYTSSAGRVD